MINLRDRVHNFFARADARPSGHKLSLPFQLFFAIIQAASGGSKAVIGKFSAHGTRIRAEIRFFPFVWVNEVFEVTAGRILDCERSAVALHFSSGLPVANFPWQDCKGRYATSRNGVCDNSGMLIGHFFLTEKKSR